MNNWLANSYETLNAVLAGISMIASVVVGIALMAKGEILIGSVTVIGGVLLTIMVFGVMAVIIDIRYELYRLGPYARTEN